MSRAMDFGWFEVREFSHGVIGIAEPGHFEDVKSYLVIGHDHALLVDTGMGLSSIKAVVEKFTDRPIHVVNSHGHLDHIGDNWRFERRWTHPLEVDRIQAGVPNERMRSLLGEGAYNRPPPTDLDVETFRIPGSEIERTVDEGDEIDLGGRVLRVIHTPGHLAGSISFLEERTGILIAGDTIYEGPLFAHHEDASARDYRSTLGRLKELAAQLSIVYPSHNRHPLDPAFIFGVHAAMEEIWNGRAADSFSDGRIQWDFGSFSFSFRDDWRDEQEGDVG